MAESENMPKLLCAWCGRPNAVIRPIMSEDYRACKTCYTIWHEQYPVSPEKLRELSLAQVP